MAGYNSKYNRADFDQKIGYTEIFEVGGRNYAIGSPENLLDKVGMGANSNTNTGNFNYQMTFNLSDVSSWRGRIVTVSVEIYVQNVTLLRQDSNTAATRIGFESSIVFADGTTQFLSAWKTLVLGESYRGIIANTYTIQDKEISRVAQAGIYIQVGAADILQVGRPKIEIGNVHTAYSRAPEDLLNSLNDMKTNLTGAPAKITALESSVL